MKNIIIGLLTFITLNVNAQLYHGTGGSIQPNVPTSNTNVGIGNINPPNKLTVDGDAINDGILVNQTAPAAPAKLSLKGGGGARWDLLSTSSLDPGSLVFYNFTQGKERMRINNDGKVGIGTGSPDADLDIRNTNNSANPGSIKMKAGDGGFELASGDDDKSYIDFKGSTNLNADYVGRIRHSDLTGFDLFTNYPANTTEVMHLGNDMKVGIGTSIPNQKLHVHNGAIQISGNIAGAGPTILFGGGESDLPNVNGRWGIEYEPNAGGLNFWKPYPNSNAFGNYFLFLANTGKVGIKTSTPAYDLDVCGTIRAKAIKVNLTGCDFVFEDTYKLMPLDELDKFIRLNKHLPEVDPAKVMEASDVSIGEMQSKLLQKVEELTLYVIQIQKENIDLRKKLDSLSNVSNPDNK